MFQFILMVVSAIVLFGAIAYRASAHDGASASERAPGKWAAAPARRAPAPEVTRASLDFTPTPRLAAPAMHVPLSGPELGTRLRDRYIAARFPGIADSAAELADTGKVVTMARLLFDEDRGDDAQELLQFAIGLSDTPEPLRLARLEITFLRRDAARYLAFAREFRDAHPGNGAWPEVMRLGRALLPGEPLFAAPPGHRANDNYGPWPDMPNWIGASWDLTPEVLASEFHNAMRNQRKDRT